MFRAIFGRAMRAPTEQFQNRHYVFTRNGGFFVASLVIFSFFRCQFLHKHPADYIFIKKFLFLAK